MNNNKVSINFASFRKYCCGRSTTCDGHGGVVTSCTLFEGMVNFCYLSSDCNVWKKLRKNSKFMRTRNYKHTYIRRERDISFPTLQKYCDQKFRSSRAYKKKKYEDEKICGIASKCDFPKHEFVCCKKNCPRWYKLGCR